MHQGAVDLVRAHQARGPGHRQGVPRRAPGHRGHRRVRPDGPVQHADLLHGRAVIVPVLLQPDGRHRRSRARSPLPRHRDDQAHPRQVRDHRRRRPGPRRRPRARRLLAVVRVAPPGLLPRPGRPGPRRSHLRRGLPRVGAEKRSDGWGGIRRRRREKRHPRVHPRALPRARVLPARPPGERRETAPEPGRRAPVAASTGVHRGARLARRVALRSVPRQAGGFRRPQRPRARRHGDAVRRRDQRRGGSRDRHRVAERGGERVRQSRRGGRGGVRRGVFRHRRLTSRGRRRALGVPRARGGTRASRVRTARGGRRRDARRGVRQAGSRVKGPVRGVPREAPSERGGAMLGAARRRGDAGDGVRERPGRQNRGRPQAHRLRGGRLPRRGGRPERARSPVWFFARLPEVCARRPRRKGARRRSLRVRDGTAKGDERGRHGERAGAKGRGARREGPGDGYEGEERGDARERRGGCEAKSGGLGASGGVVAERVRIAREGGGCESVSRAATRAQRVRDDRGGGVESGGESEGGDRRGAQASGGGGGRRASARARTRVGSIGFHRAARRARRRRVAARERARADARRARGGGTRAGGGGERG